MTTMTEFPTATATLRAVEALAPTISARATEIEAGRRLPPDLLDQLHAAGAFRLLLPPSHGGAGVSITGGMDVFAALSRADASTAWAVALGAGAWCDLTGLPRATFDEMYDSPARMIAGVFKPSGTATAVSGGFEVSGRWSFASGSPYADWLYGNTVEMVDGEPSFRTVLFRPDEVAIEDTWHVLGMRGTASHDFVADRVTVPESRTFATFLAEPCVDVPIARIPQPSLFALALASIVLGAARGAIDDVLALATEKVPLLAQSPLAANPLFQHEIARADTQLRAVHSLLWDCADELWAVAEAGAPPAPELITRIRAGAAFAAGTAVEVVGTAFRFGGGTTLFDASPLQRRLRDVNVIAQHFLVKPDTLTTAGARMLDQPVDVPVF